MDKDVGNEIGLVMILCVIWSGKRGKEKGIHKKVIIMGYFLTMFKTASSVRGAGQICQS